MKKLDGRTKAGRAAKLAAKRMAIADHWGIGKAGRRDITEAQDALNAAARNSIDNILTERGTRYGEFASHAFITQQIKQTMHCSPKWTDLQDDQTEALEMIAHKIGRILNGDPNYADSWVDIAGYAKLVSDRLEKEKK